MKLLEHVTILDLSRVLACPFASMILAELGAAVIKIEEPRAGDETRSFEPFVEKNGAAESAYYFACNRGKQSVTVNLRSPDGQAIIRDLARRPTCSWRTSRSARSSATASTIRRSAPSTSASSTCPAPASARPAPMRTARATTPSSRPWAAS